MTILIDSVETPWTTTLDRLSQNQGAVLPVPGTANKNVEGFT
jgi:hypothetical protein